MILALQLLSNGAGEWASGCIRRYARFGHVLPVARALRLPSPPDTHRARGIVRGDRRGCHGGDQRRGDGRVHSSLGTAHVLQQHSRAAASDAR